VPFTGLRRLVAPKACALLVVGLVTIIGGCGGGTGDSGAGANPSACKQVEAPKPKSVSFKAPKQTVKKGEALTAVVETSCGSFDIALDTTRAPKTVNSFVFLSEEGFYDGLDFDGAAPGSFLQGGAPPVGDADGPDYSIKGELPPNLRYTKGIVAMSPSSGMPPGQVGSQYFIVLAPYVDIGGVYPPLGRIDKGYGVVERIAKLGPPAEGESNPGSTGVIGKLRRTVLIEGVSIKRE